MKVAVAYEAGQPLFPEDLPVPAVGPHDARLEASLAVGDLLTRAEGVRTVVVNGTMTDAP